MLVVPLDPAMRLAFEAVQRAKKLRAVVVAVGEISNGAPDRDPDNASQPMVGAKTFLRPPPPITYLPRQAVRLSASARQNVQMQREPGGGSPSHRMVHQASAPSRPGRSPRSAARRSGDERGPSRQA